ncbi:MAG: glycosyltransferase [Opitutales bacterium]|jgi:glycosyltransferase involved in cell wall biosynthesis
MRILKTTHSLAPAGGGVATAIDTLSRAQIALGHTIEVACLDDPSAPWLAQRAYPVHAFPSTRFHKYGWCPAFARWLRENLRRFDVVAIEGLWQYPGPATRSAAHAAHIPYVVYPHGMLDPWFRRAYPSKHLKKMLYWLLVEHRVLRDARAVIFTAEEEHRLAEGSFHPWSARSVVAPLGVAAPSGNPAERARLWYERFPALAHRRALLFLGRLDRKKGVDLLLEAYASIHPSAARVAGTAPALVLAGPESSPSFAANIRIFAKLLHLREGVDVIWTGLLDGDAKWAALESADALVLPSHQENFGYAVAEALAVGTPVLISERVNIWREIVAARAGLAAPDDAAGTRRLLAAHANWTPVDRRQFSAAARACFAEHFQLEAAARRQLAVLAAAVQGAPTTG